MSSRIDKGTKFKPQVAARRRVGSGPTTPGSSGSRAMGAMGDSSRSSQVTSTQTQTQRDSQSTAPSAATQNTAPTYLSSDAEDDADDRRIAYSNEPPRLIAALPGRSSQVPSIQKSTPLAIGTRPPAGLIGAVTMGGTVAGGSGGMGGGGGISMIRPFQSSATGARAVNRSSTPQIIPTMTLPTAAVAGNARRGSSATPSVASQRASSVARSISAMSPPPVPKHAQASLPMPIREIPREAGRTATPSSRASATPSPRIAPQSAMRPVAALPLPIPAGAALSIAGPSRSHTPVSGPPVPLSAASDRSNEAPSVTSPQQAAKMLARASASTQVSSDAAPASAATAGQKRARLSKAPAASQPDSARAPAAAPVVEENGHSGTDDAPMPPKRPRGRPRKVASDGHAPRPNIPATTAQTQDGTAPPAKRGRGRPRKDAVAPAVADSSTVAPSRKKTITAENTAKQARKKGMRSDEPEDPFTDSDLASTDEDDGGSGTRNRFKRKTPAGAVRARAAPDRDSEGSGERDEDDVEAADAPAATSAGPARSVFEQITTPTWAEKAEEYKAAKAAAKLKRLKKRRRKNPRQGEPIKPISAYLEFCARERAAHADDWRAEGLQLSAISKILSIKWKALPDATRRTMKEEAAAAMEAYKEARTAWLAEHPEGTADEVSSDEVAPPVRASGASRALPYFPRHRSQRRASEDEADYHRRLKDNPESLRVDSQLPMADIAAEDFTRGRAGKNTFDAIRYHEKAREAERKRRVDDLKRKARKSRNDWRRANGETVQSDEDDVSDESTQRGSSAATKAKEKVSVTPAATGADRGDEIEETEEIVGSGDDDPAYRRYQRGDDYSDSDEEDERMSPGPAFRPNANAAQMRMQDGKMVLNQASLHRTRNQSLEEGPVVEVDPKAVFYNSTTKSKHVRGDKWSTQETEAFYEAHSVWGTDFGIIARLFPRRTRDQIRQKYNREMKFNPDLIGKAFEQKNAINLEEYGLAIGLDLSGPIPKITPKQLDLSGAGEADVSEEEVEVTDEDCDGPGEVDEDGVRIKKTKKVRRAVKKSTSRTPSVRPSVRRPSVSSARGESASRASGSQPSDDDDEELPDTREILERSRRASSAHSASARSARSASVLSTATATSTRTGTQGASSRTQRRREVERDRKSREDEMRKEREKSRRAGALSKPADEEVVIERDGDEEAVVEGEEITEAEDESD